MKFAWIENERIRDVAPNTPEDIYHPEVAVFYDTQVPDDAQNGDGWVNGQLVKPTPLPPMPNPTRTWTNADIRAGLTLSERVKWDNDTTPEIVTAKLEMSQPQELSNTTEVLNLLVSTGSISQTSVNKILA